MVNYDKKNTNSIGTFTVPDVVLRRALDTHTHVTHWKITHNDALGSISVKKLTGKISSHIFRNLSVKFKTDLNIKKKSNVS